MIERNGGYLGLLVKAIARGVMLYALGLSFMHTITAAHLIGITGWQADTAPVFVDVFAVLGMICRSKRFSDGLRRFGLKLQIGAGVFALVSNVTAGENAGMRFWGVVTVAGYWIAEYVGDRIAAEIAADQQRRAAEQAEAEIAAAAAAADRAVKDARNEAARARRAAKKNAPAKTGRKLRAV